jgi:hypothetical protein
MHILPHFLHKILSVQIKPAAHGQLVEQDWASVGAVAAQVPVVTPKKLPF